MGEFAAHDDDVPIRFFFILFSLCGPREQFGAPQFALAHRFPLGCAKKPTGTAIFDRVPLIPLRPWK